MKWFSTIQFRLSIWFALAMGGVCAVLILYFALELRAESLATARATALATAGREADLVEGQLNKAMDVARVLAHSLGAMADQPGGGSRSEANTIMRRVLEQHPEFLDVFTLWEPDAFDGADARFKGRPGHDATGRFIPVWNRAQDGTLAVEAALFYENPGIGDYYVLPRRYLRETFLEPYEYPLRGTPVLMTSLVVPILRGGRFVGIAGVDYRVDYLQQLADRVQLFKGTGRLFILSQGKVVAGATGRPAWVGRKHELPFPPPPASFDREAILASGETLCAYRSIQVGSAQERWQAVLTVPLPVVMAGANHRIALGMAGASAFCLMGIVGTLLMVRLKIVRGIQRLTRATEAMAAGDYGIEIDVAGLDEIQRLAEAFNAMTRHIAATLKNLRDSEALRKDAIDGSISYYAVLSPGGDLEFANRTALKAGGIPLEDLAGRPFWTLGWWDPSTGDPARIREGVETAARGGRFTGILSYRSPEGALRKANVTISPLRDSGGGITSLLCEGRDITEEIAAKEALEISEARYRRIVEDAPLGVYRIRLAGAFEFANRVTLAQFECASLEELNARFGTPEKRWHSREAFDEYVRTLRREGRILGQEVEIRLPDGRERFHSIYSFLDRNEDIISGFLVDITGSKHMAQQLAQAQKLEAVGQLAGGVAHDFNNILAGILGAAEVLRKGGEETPTRDRLLGMIIASAERAGRLTHKLLAFSRKTTKATRPVNVADLVNDAVEILQRTLDKSIRIQVEAESAHPWVAGDDAMLLNALLNLGINAGHAMPGGGSLRFRLRDRRLDEAYCGQSPFDLVPGDYLEIEVRDTGTGIPSEIQARIFEPFFTTKKPGEGTGLGLFGVYGSIREHRGAISLESWPGKGTTFRVHLPLSPAEEEAALTQDEGLRGTGTILLIDDEEMIRVTYGRILERLGYTVLTAANGVEGLEIFRKRRGGIRLVILDAIMPAMGGLTTLQRIRDLDANLPVIMCSGFPRPEEMPEILASGLAEFLEKPVRSDELAAAVARALRQAPYA